jgi:hypothetical protein
MNRLVRTTLITAVCLCAAAGAWAQSSSGKLDLARWFSANENWKTVNNGQWSNDPKDAPTDKELTTMMDIACKVQTAINWNEFFFIAVRDPAEQEAIINGTQWKGSTSNGTVTLIILADLVADQAHRKDAYDPKKLIMQSPMAYFDSGMACGFLNLAAYSLGYSTHYFASASGKSITPTDKTTFGFGQYPTPNWNISRFLKGRNYVRSWGFPNPEVKFDVEGNCVMIAAVVIGKPNPSVDATTAATQHGRPSNYAFWSPDRTTPPLK